MYTQRFNYGHGRNTLDAIQHIGPLPWLLGEAFLENCAVKNAIGALNAYGCISFSAHKDVEFCFNMGVPGTSDPVSSNAIHTVKTLVFCPGRFHKSRVQGLKALVNAAQSSSSCTFDRCDFQRNTFFGDA